MSLVLDPEVFVADGCRVVVARRIDDFLTHFSSSSKSFELSYP